MLVATYTADGERISQVMRWGLIPWWAKDLKVGVSTFNAARRHRPNQARVP
jgi:putative SOS response-associated peptidase YedK